VGSGIEGSDVVVVVVVVQLPSLTNIITNNNIYLSINSNNKPLPN